jgi:aminoglycoside phosphotransferase (APT) family kinase protein
MQEHLLVKPVSLAAARNVIRGRILDIAAGKIMYLGGGSSSAFSVDDRLVVKFPKLGHQHQRYDHFVKQFAREQALYKSLSARVSPDEVVTPIAMIARPWLGFSGPIFTYKYLAGTQVAKMELASKQKRRLAHLLGRFLTKLHSIRKINIPGIPKITPESIRLGWNEQYETVKRDVMPLLNRTERNWMAGLYDSYLSGAGMHPPRVVFSHGDFGAENVLVPKRFDRLQVIDFENVCWGDPVGDFCVWYQSYGEKFLEDMLTSYGGRIDKHFGARVRFYAGRLPVVYFGLYKKSGNRNFLAYARRYLGQVMQGPAPAPMAGKR